MPAAAPFQVHEPAAHQRRQHAREQPEREGAPEGAREEREEVRDLEREVGRPERRERGDGGEVAQGQDLGPQPPGFDEEGQQFDARDRAEGLAEAVQGVGQGGVGEGGREAVDESGCVGVYLFGEDGGGGGQGDRAGEGEGAGGGFGLVGGGAGAGGVSACSRAGEWISDWVLSSLHLRDALGEINGGGV